MHPHLSSFLSSHLLDRKGGHRKRVLSEFARHLEFDRLSSEERQIWQDRMLADLLTHARDHVPRFREALRDSGDISPGNAREVLSSLPVMRRSDIQSNPEMFLSDATPVFRDDATGGSTGTPMSFKVDRETYAAREASLMWANALAGWSPGERIAMLWGSDRDVTSATRRVRSDFRWFIENRRWFNAFDMGEEQMARFHAELTRFRPHLLVAYAGAVFQYARFLDSRDTRPSYPLSTIVSSAEVITSDMRRVVEEVFHKPVFDRYGNREMGAIAAQCSEHPDLHVNESDIILEIDSEDPCRKPGPIMITYLRNYAMPLIRYETGDVGRLHSTEACGCGRTSMQIAPMVGRESDVIKTSTGKLIHGEFFTHILYNTKAVREFQFIQKATDRYELRVVASPKDVRDQEKQWRARILEAVGVGSQLEVQYVGRDTPPVIWKAQVYDIRDKTGERIAEP